MFESVDRWENSFPRRRCVIPPDVSRGAACRPAIALGEMDQGERAMEARIGALVTGCASRVPGLRKLTARQTGGTNSARYCYAVWLRHLHRMNEAGLPTHFETMLELGPGDSLGIGFAALLSAADRYVGLDIVRYANPARDLAIFRELVWLFQTRAPIPDGREFPRVHPSLPDYGFPHGLLSSARLAEMLCASRVRELEDLILRPPGGRQSNARLRYIVPWGPDSVPRDSVDLILSQSVLQYAPNLRTCYEDLERWIRPGGVMSHEVDFKSIGRTRSWNGHWACSPVTWAAMQGRRRNPLNRAALSEHLRIQQALGFDVLTCVRDVRSDGITRGQLAPGFAHLDAEDLTTASALFQSRRHADAEIPGEPRTSA